MKPKLAVQQLALFSPHAGRPLAREAVVIEEMHRAPSGERFAHVSRANGQMFVATMDQLTPAC